MGFFRFLTDCARQLVHANRLYWAWVITLGVVALQGLLAYVDQLRHGLVTTGLHDHVPWGTYIANFGFLYGIAASSSPLLIATFVFARADRIRKRHRLFQRQVARPAVSGPPRVPPVGRPEPPVCPGNPPPPGPPMVATCSSGD